MLPARLDYSATRIGSGYKVATITMYLRRTTGFGDFKWIKLTQNRNGEKVR
jgi:hypothetical protein